MTGLGASAGRRPGARFQVDAGQQGKAGRDGILPLRDLALAPELLLLTVTDVDTATGKPLAGTLKWPDGATGDYAATVDGFGISGYSVTHVDGDDVRTFTQSAVTRDASGFVTARPEITED